MTQPMTLEQHTELLQKAFAHLEQTMHQDLILAMFAVCVLLMILIIVVAIRR